MKLGHIGFPVSSSRSPVAQKDTTILFQSFCTAHRNKMQRQACLPHETVLPRLVRLFSVPSREGWILHGGDAVYMVFFSWSNPIAQTFVAIYCLTERKLFSALVSSPMLRSVSKRSTIFPVPKLFIRKRKEKIKRSAVYRFC